MAFVKFKPITSIFVFYSRIEIGEIKDEINNYVVDNERILFTFKSKRDFVVFTDKRILLVDKKGFRGFRRSISAINYSSISSYELKIRNVDSLIDVILDSGHKATMRFSKPIPLDDVYVIYKYIAMGKMKN